MRRSEDWLNQAQRDLESAEWAKQGAFYEWACFMSQQAAEKALKAVLEGRGMEAWGHSVEGLLKVLAKEVPADEYRALRRCAKRLDEFYVPIRYPNGWQEGSPHEHYTEEDADEALACARKILRFCTNLLAGS